MAKKSNPDVSTISNSYDGYGNLSQVILSDGPTYNYSYDLEGRLKNSSVSGGSSSEYGYDAVGNLISHMEKDAGSNTITTVDAPATGMYSKLDQLLGYKFTYKDYTGNPVNFSFDYTKAGTVNSITGDGKKFSFGYDESNNPVSKVYPNNIQANYIYNEANRLTGIRTVDSSSNVKWSSKYRYNSDGRLIEVTGSGPGSPSASYTYNNGTEKLNRLTEAVINDGSNIYTFNYSYDAAGNIKEMDVANGTGTPSHLSLNYDEDNRIISTGFGYDANGNLTQAVIAGKTYKYVYDAANRLTEVKDGAGAVIASYSYDGDGKRLTKTVNGVTTTYHYFGGQLLYETLSTDPSNVIHALYIRSPQGKLQAVSFNYEIGGASNTYYYYHYNVHGDVTAVTDGNGNVYRQYIYDPYGNVISVKDGSGADVDINNDSGFDHVYTYAGYRYDKESGLYFLNARYYAAGIGRFLTKDAIVGETDNPKSLNRYAYTHGDPVNLKDPSGFRPAIGAYNPEGDREADYEFPENDGEKIIRQEIFSQPKIEKKWYGTKTTTRSVTKAVTYKGNSKRGSYESHLVVVDYYGYITFNSPIQKTTKTVNYIYDLFVGTTLVKNPTASTDKTVAVPLAVLATTLTYANDMGYKFEMILDSKVVYSY